jgi:hypothetical protein
MKKVNRKVKKKVSIKKKQILKSGVIRKQAHASSRTKRNQAAKDSRNS